VNLYELSAELRSLSEQLEDVDEQTMIDTIDGSTQMMNFEDKAAGVVKFVKNIEGDTSILDNEIKRLTERKRSLDNKTVWLKNYLQICMERSNVEKLKFPSFTVSIQNNPAAVSVLDQTKIPEQFIKTTITQSVDKAKIKDAFKDGQAVPGCELVQGRSLRIR